MRILVGDIGGTNTRLALWDDGLHIALEPFPSSRFPGLEGPVRHWLAATGARVDAACFAVAGPVSSGRCTATNLPWVVDAAELSDWLCVPTRVINDFHAAARGLALLGPADVATLVPGEAAPGAPVAVLGAGTGLGEALVVGGSVVPGEGGHAEFGPSDTRELAFCAWLHERYGRASWEHVLSGPGLVNLARFTYATRGLAPDWLDNPDAPARIVAEEPELIAWFAELYGAEAGNMALRVLAKGGVYLCGGIAPRILPHLQGEGFRRRFYSKGKVGAALTGIPVRVVLHPHLGLLGAAAEVLS